MSLGKFALQLIARFPALAEVPIVDLIPVVQPLFSAYQRASAGTQEINELQGDRQ